MRSVFFQVIFSVSAQLVIAQVPSGGGLIVNELNQGASGTKEFIEFLVLGDPANPCADVDLTGWIFDDNNGSFESCGTGVGIATGHYRFSSCYSAVPPGSILVVYNNSDVYAGMPAADPTDADGDLVYIIPSNNACLEANYVQPVSSPVNCNYAGPYGSPTATWASGFANSGDAVQVRKPDHSFFHGFSYGDVSGTYPTWPAGADPGSSFNKGSGNLALDCGSCWSSASYFTTTAGAGTPGTANTVNNGYFINNLRTCLLDYTDLDDPDNCTLLLELMEGEIAAVQSGNSVEISWIDSRNIYDDATVYRSASGNTFTALETIATSSCVTVDDLFVYYDREPEFSNYYFVVWEDAYDEKYTSNIVRVEFRSPVRIYPNPADDYLLVECGSGTELFCINTQGTKTILPVVSNHEKLITLDVRGLPAGCYFLADRYGNHLGTFVRR